MQKFWLGFISMAVALSACAGPEKEDAKGQVDESQPPSIPLEAGKSDAAAKIVTVNVQSTHPYANNLNKLFYVPLTGLPSCAKTARLHFRILRTEANYDLVTVEPTGEPYQEFDGNRDNTWTEWFDINSSSVRVRLQSDSSITRHGFEIDKVEWDGAPANCPVVAQCAANQVNLAQAPGACECPVVPQCVSNLNVEMAHHLARGFNNTTKRAHGATATYTHPGPADGPETDTIGTVDPVQLGVLVRRAAALGLLAGPGYTTTVPAGTMYDELTITAGAYSVSFVAGQGSHTPVVQALITDFEALFTCGGGGLTCGAGYECEQGSCIESQGCFCPALYDPVCGTNGQTYSNGCAAGCANVGVAHDGECGAAGDVCGTIAGLVCLDDNKCRYAPSTYTAPYPDAGGVCREPNYCDAPVDCNGLPHIAVPGAWACNNNLCAWQAGPIWKTVTNGHFETTNPYAHNMSVWHEVYLPAEAQVLRLNATRFRTEAGYDKLEVWTWKNGAWTKIKTYSGTTGPALTEEFPGVYHYLRFVSDSSVRYEGVSLDAQWR